MEEKISAYLVPRVDQSAGLIAKNFECTKETIRETLLDLEARGFVAQTNGRWNQTNLGFRFYQTILAERARK